MFIPIDITRMSSLFSFNYIFSGQAPKIFAEHGPSSPACQRATALSHFLSRVSRARDAGGNHLRCARASERARSASGTSRPFGCSQTRQSYAVLSLSSISWLPTRAACVNLPWPQHTLYPRNKNSIPRRSRYCACNYYFTTQPITRACAYPVRRQDLSVPRVKLLNKLYSAHARAQ